MLCSDTFPTMPIKHLRRGCFVTHSKITICYPLIINAKHGYIENFHQQVNRPDFQVAEALLHAISMPLHWKS